MSEVDDPVASHAVSIWDAAREGNVAVVRSLTAEDQRNVTLHNHANATPLHLAGSCL